MSKLYFLVLCLLVSKTGFAAKPDESGIGGTGTNKPQINDLIFNRPNVPDTIEIPVPQVPQVPQIEIPNTPNIQDSLPAIEAFSETPTEHNVTDIPEK